MLKTRQGEAAHHDNLSQKPQGFSDIPSVKQEMRSATSVVIHQESKVLAQNYRKSQRRIVCTMALLLGLFALSILTDKTLKPDDHALLIVILVWQTLLFLFFAFVPTRPPRIIDEDGLFIRDSGSKQTYRVIPWKEIKDIKTRNLGPMVSLTVHYRDSDEVRCVRVKALKGHTTEVLDRGPYPATSTETIIHTNFVCSKVEAATILRVFHANASD